jgi:hypothetical protein
MLIVAEEVQDKQPPSTLFCGEGGPISTRKERRRRFATGTVLRITARHAPKAGLFFPIRQRILILRFFAHLQTLPYPNQHQLF